MGRSYPHLSLEERRRIEDWWHAKVPVGKSAGTSATNRTPKTHPQGKALERPLGCRRRKAIPFAMAGE